jgi:hypothetical protein
MNSMLRLRWVMWLSWYAGKYVEHYTIKKGGSDPEILFGPQAGRKEGVAPALSTYLTAYRFYDLASYQFVQSGVTESRAENRPENRKENRVQHGSPLFQPFYNTTERPFYEDMEHESTSPFNEWLTCSRRSGQLSPAFEVNGEPEQCSVHVACLFLDSFRNTI